MEMKQTILAYNKVAAETFPLDLRLSDYSTHFAIRAVSRAWQRPGIKTRSIKRCPTV